MKPRLAERLNGMGLVSVLDLLRHYPRRYHDRTRVAPIAGMQVGEEATVFGEVVRSSGRQTKNRKRLVEVVLTDGESQLLVTFFNQAWRERQLSEGTEVAVFGKLDSFRGRRQMVNPVVDVLGRAGESKTGVIQAVYPESGKHEVSTWELARVVERALDWTGDLVDPLPVAVREDLKLVDRTHALREIHRPETMEEVRRAQRRLRFDEFLVMQVGLVARKRAIEARNDGIRHTVEGPLVQRFLDALPFALTGEQRAAIDAIDADMARPVPMHRLLQGEVGSGKTVVAMVALLTAVESGYQGALMAPTEVLAEQLHAVATALMRDLEVPAPPDQLIADRPLGVALLTNRVGAAERKRIRQGLADGTVDIVVGTHALLFDDAPFTRLGVVVIDEQHRFGVEQRDALRQRGGEAGAPDVLVMTATPIPRTSAMLVYGDLDHSELHELPAGRKPITTEVLGTGPLDREPAYARLREEVAAGRQGYVVCPLVEGSARVEAKAATEEYERLQAEELAGLRVGLLHGQMPSSEKEAVMTAFRDRELDVLVATTVIEVGVDVPNATVMVIEDAQRFGLSQLHQLRGRVGRGGAASWCYLVADTSTPDAEARMEAMADPDLDGFGLAEKDLEIRGEGRVLGERQAGMSELRLGKLPRDERYVVFARRTAEQLLDADPDLARNRPLAEEVEDLLGDDVEYLFKG